MTGDLASFQLDQVTQIETAGRQTGTDGFMPQSAESYRRILRHIGSRTGQAHQAGLGHLLDVLRAPDAITQIRQRSGEEGLVEGP